ncbi:RNA polymerase II-associated protein 3-like isoform X2 [Zootermopsis nevadensis]|uniref:RNA polymerase II-associated protein 3-like isoform X2 n=1 Tax=Zootermopsis nevadensis TaxID=136037 RepID=UPI000B8EC037|nr:RNA polymerase II-associated protein 3-like isoform X2 [Zootermopsis nevadensis]
MLSCIVDPLVMDPVLLQKQVLDNAEDLRSYMQDLKSWEADMKRKESELATTASDDQALPPVRTKIKKISEVQKSKHEKQNEMPARISGYDYASWDKFDVDKACEEFDGGRHQESEGDKDTVSDSEEKQIREEAVYEKEMGNDLVKSKKWKEAIRCYSRAINCFPYDAIFYANRALCYLKTEDLRSAEADCTAALQLDSSYVKAYQRRAMARAGLGQLQEARADLLKVMELEPKNMASKAELMKLEKKINIKPQQNSVKEPGFATCSKNIVSLETDKQVKISSYALKDKKAEKETDTRNESKMPLKQIIREEKEVSQMSVNKTTAVAEVKKDEKCFTDQEIIDEQSGESRLLENIVTEEEIWSTHGEVELVYSIHKPPHLRSKKALKRIEIQEVDNHFSRQLGTSNKICTANSVENEHHQITVGLDTGKPTDVKEQKTEGFHKVNDVESSKMKSTSENENSTSQSKVTDHLTEMVSEKVPPIPNTSVQFQVAWKKVRTDPHLSYLYLKQIPGAYLPKIFRDSLESSTLSDIISTIKTEFIQFKEPALSFLMGLSDVRRFGALAMFLSESDKAGVKKILEYCKEQGECSEEDSIDLMTKYELY